MKIAPPRASWVMFVALLSALIIVILAAIWASDRRAPARDDSTEVPCASGDCLSASDVESLIGFEPLEPSRLPSGYVLYSRTVPLIPLSEETRRAIAEQRGLPLTEVPETAPPMTVHLQYRFGGRVNVPAIEVVQRMDSSSDSVTLELDEASCGEVLDLDGGRAFYGEGTGSLQPSGTPGIWMTCPADGDLQAGNLVFARSQVLVEIKAFPESGLTKDELLAFAESMFRE